MANIPIGGQLDFPYQIASVDKRFGPYVSVAAAYAALGPDGDDVITAGLPFGITQADGSTTWCIWTKTGGEVTDYKRISHMQVVPFAGVVTTSVTIAQVGGLSQDGSTIKYLAAHNTFGYQSGTSYVTTWQNDYIWIDGDTRAPYKDILYVDKVNGSAYFYNGTALIELTPHVAIPVTSVNGKTGAVVLNKSDIGLGNVDNTSDVNKPISTATQTALDAKANASDLTSHTGNTNNPHQVTKAQVGLGNVDNTADADKNVNSAVKDGSGNTITDTYETKTHATSNYSSLQGDIDSLAAIAANLTGLEGTNFGGFSLAVDAATAVSNIPTVFTQNGCTVGQLYWFLAGADMSALVAYKYNGTGSATAISATEYDFTDFSGLSEQVKDFKGTITSLSALDALYNTSDVGVYHLKVSQMSGLLIVEKHNDGLTTTISQQLIGSGTPTNQGGSYVIEAGQTLARRTYSSGAWTAWNDPIATLKSQVDALGHKIDEIVGGETEVERTISNYTEQRYIKMTDGSISTNNTWGYYEASFVRENLSALYAVGYFGRDGSGSSTDGVAFFDSSHNFISVFQSLISGAPAYSLSLQQIPNELIPSNAAYVAYNIPMSYTGDLKGKIVETQETGGIAGNVAQLQSDVQTINEQLDGIDDTIKDVVDANYTMPTYVEEQVGKNLFNKQGKIYQGFVYSNGSSSSGTSNWDNVAEHSSGTFATTYPIPVIGGKSITISPTSNDQIYIAEYDKNGVFVNSTKSLGTSTTIALSSTTAIVRVSFKYANLASLQVEYGTSATSYEEYVEPKKVISKDSLPSISVSDVAGLSEMVDEKVEREKQTKIVLPKTMFFMVGKKNNLYYNQCIKTSPNVQNVIRLAPTNGSVTFGNSIFTNPQQSGNYYWSYLRVYKDGDLIGYINNIIVKHIAAPSSAKSIKVMTIGDSMTDLGYYQRRLSEYLSDDNVSISFIGAKMKLSSGIRYEAQSGGNTGYISSSMGVAKVISVNGMTSIPETGYPGAKYVDANNTEWTVIGHKLTENNGLYSGKIKIGISGGASSTAFPTSGTLTKSNSYSGDSTITYSLLSTEDYNPFWNVSTSQIDWQHYFNLWEFDIPDVVVFQYGYNEVSGQEEKDDASVVTSTTRAKAAVDKLHEQYPNVKVIFAVETYGSEIPTYAGNQSSAGIKKYGQLSLAEAFLDIFESSEYASFVTFVPIYARMDAINGFGSITTKKTNDCYANADGIKCLVNGFDGVHPPYEYGMQEFALAYEPIIVNLASALT